MPSATKLTFHRSGWVLKTQRQLSKWSWDPNIFWKLITPTIHWPTNLSHRLSIEPPTTHPSPFLTQHFNVNEHMGQFLQDGENVRLTSFFLKIRVLVWPKYDYWLMSANQTFQTSLWKLLNNLKSWGVVWNNSLQMFILRLWSLFVQCLACICPAMDTFWIAISTLPYWKNLLNMSGIHVMYML